MESHTPIDENFEDALPGLLPPDAAGQARLNSLIGKLKKITYKENN